MTKKAYCFIFIIFLIVLIAAGCYNYKEDKEESYMNINIFKNSDVWGLAQEVNRQNVTKIKEISKKDPELLNYQDKEYDLTLLIWAVGTEKYNSAEALLQSGANPDIISEYFGYNALYLASGYSWVDNSQAKKDAKYVKLLLKYNADPNICFAGSAGDTMTEIGTSPLIESVYCGIDKTKALIDGGADLNYKTPSGRTAAIESLYALGPNSTIDPMRVAHYLIAEKKAAVTDSYKPLRSMNPDPNEKFFPVDLLRYWMPELDTEEHYLKLEVIDEFENQGVDYWSTPILPRLLDQIKKRYPQTWPDYIKRY